MVAQPSGVSATILDFVSSANLSGGESGSGEYTFTKFSFTTVAQSKLRVKAGSCQVTWEECLLDAVWLHCVKFEGVFLHFKALGIPH